MHACNTVAGTEACGFKAVLEVEMTQTLWRDAYVVFVCHTKHKLQQRKLNMKVISI